MRAWQGVSQKLLKPKFQSLLKLGAFFESFRYKIQKFIAYNGAQTRDLQLRNFFLTHWAIRKEKNSLEGVSNQRSVALEPFCSTHWVI